jgi:hypothetical protein
MTKVYMGLRFHHPPQRSCSAVLSTVSLKCCYIRSNWHPTILTAWNLELQACRRNSPKWIPLRTRNFSSTIISGPLLHRKIGNSSHAPFIMTRWACAVLPKNVMLFWYVRVTRGPWVLIKALRLCYKIGWDDQEKNLMSLGLWWLPNVMSFYKYTESLPC